MPEMQLLCERGMLPINAADRALLTQSLRLLSVSFNRLRAARGPAPEVSVSRRDEAELTVIEMMDDWLQARFDSIRCWHIMLFTKEMHAGGKCSPPSNSLHEFIPTRSCKYDIPLDTRTASKLSVSCCVPWKPHDITCFFSSSMRQGKANKMSRADARDRQA